MYIRKMRFSQKCFEKCGIFVYNSRIKVIIITFSTKRWHFCKMSKVYTSITCATWVHCTTYRLRLLLRFCCKEYFCSNVFTEIQEIAFSRIFDTILSVDAVFNKLCVHDKVLLVKLFYINTESASLALRSCRTMRGVKNVKESMIFTNWRLWYKGSSKRAHGKFFKKIGRPQTSDAVVNEIEHDDDTQSTLSAHSECFAPAFARRTDFL